MVSLSSLGGVLLMTEEFLLHLPFKEKCCFFGSEGVTVIVGSLEGNDQLSVMWCGEGPY